MTRTHLWDEDEELSADAAKHRTERRANGHAGNGRVTLVPFDEMLPNLSEADLVAKLIGSSQLSTVYGPPGCGKTFFVLDIALAIATGEEWFGRRVKQGPVVYIAAEAGRRIFNRVFAWRSRRGYMMPKTARQVPFYVEPMQVDLCNSDADLDELVLEIHEKCGRDDPLLIVIDTVARVMAGGNENSPEDMGALIAAADRLRDEFNAHICLIHHVGKDAGRGARGHSSLHGADDTEIEINRDEDTKVSTAKVVKQRDGETGEKIHFVLDVVKIGKNEETGEDVTSCVVKPADDGQIAATSRTKQKLGKAETIALNALRCTIESNGTPPPITAQCPQKLWVHEDVWRSRCYDDGISTGKPRAQQAAFQRAVEVLLKDKMIETGNGYFWLV